MLLLDTVPSPHISRPGHIWVSHLLVNFLFVLLSAQTYVYNSCIGQVSYLRAYLHDGICLSVLHCTLHL